MTDGIFINGRRPASKKQIKEAIAADPESVVIENTSAFSDRPDYPASEVNSSVTFVGPDPYTSRKFYGQIVRNAKGILVVK